MRMILAAAAMAALVGAAGAASATTFQGNFTVSAYNSNTGGLNIDIDDPSGNFNRTGLDFGESQTFHLFYLNADEGIDVPDSGNDDDSTARPITVNFTFNSPGLPGSGPDGVINGLTVGINGGRNDYGQVTWGGPAVVNFGNLGLLTITLSNDTFGEGDWNSGEVKATFALAAPAVSGGGAVPEPATWGLMITGFGMAGATLRRRRIAAVAA
jgi:hypothetical protein